MQTLERIDVFDGEYDWLSNFHEHPEIQIMIDSLDSEVSKLGCKSIEHAFQALKTNNSFERQLIACAPTPGQAKRLGRKAQLRTDWEQVKIDAMLELLIQKFSHPYYRDLLLATGDAELIEGNTWNDTFWGVCNGIGENMLGKLLMEVRKVLRS